MSRSNQRTQTRRKGQLASSKASLVAFQVPTEVILLTFWYTILAKPVGLSVNYGEAGAALQQLSNVSSPASDFYAITLFVVFLALLLGCFLNLKN